MKRLDGRICLISGASSGFGAHFARIVAAAGAGLSFSARGGSRKSGRWRGNRRFGACSSAGRHRRSLGHRRFRCGGSASFGPVDTVIANAGVSRAGRRPPQSPPRFAAHAVRHQCARRLSYRPRRRETDVGRRQCRDSGKGRIVMIGSMGAVAMIPGEVAYCASKAAVATMGRNLASEWARAGITVNVLQPGFIRHRTGRGLVLQRTWQGASRQLRPAAVAADRFAERDAAHLCSDASLHMTGSVITLDDAQSL